MQDQLERGEALFAEGKLDEAEKCFLSVIEKDPNNKEAHNNLGVIAFQRQDIKKAQNYFLTALKLDPFYQDAIDNLIALRGGDDETAKETGTVNFTNTLRKHVRIVNNRKIFIVDYCRGKHVLHIGCVDRGLVRQRLKDTTHLHHQLSLVAKRLIGIDVDKAGIDLLRRVGFSQVYVVDVENEIIPANLMKDIEVIVIPEVMEHLSNPGNFLDNLKRLDFSGDIIVSVPNAFSYRVVTLVKDNNIELVHPDHNFYFSPTTLETLLRKHGFKTIDQILYYWPTDDALGHELRNVLKQSPYLAEGLINLVKDSRYSE